MPCSNVILSFRHQGCGCDYRVTRSSYRFQNTLTHRNDLTSSLQLVSLRAAMPRLTESKTSGTRPIHSETLVTCAFLAACNVPLLTTSPKGVEYPHYCHGSTAFILGHFSTDPCISEEVCCPRKHNVANAGTCLLCSCNNLLCFAGQALGRLSSHLYSNVILGSGATDFR